MRQAVRGNAQSRTPVISSASAPAPVGGWNARDALANMPKEDAVTLENWFPRTSDCKLRSGFSEWATGLPGAVDTLMEYAGFSSRKLFAISGTGIYDASSSGAVGAAAVTVTNARWQHTMFGTSGGEFLVACNGVDIARTYDGASWANLSINNVAEDDVVHVNAHKNRLWFVEANTLSAWYLGTAAIGGDATEFTLRPVARRGGTLLAMATWTVDGGFGLDDLAVWITTEGEVIVYRGTDPASSATWALQGVYQIGRPIGRRCTAQLGGELIIICEDGYYPLSKALIASGGNPRASISDKISGAVLDAARMYGDNFGWQPILYPRGSMLLFNVPTTEGSVAEQHVMNIQTGAWCKFTSMNANCWSLFNNDLYFGGSTAVYKSDTGQSDDGDAIAGRMKPAFSYFRSPGRQKIFRMIRPVFYAGSTVVPNINMNVDFEDIPPTMTVLSNGGGGTPWGSPWGSSWGNSNAIRKDWQSVAAKTGFAGAPYMTVATNTQEIVLMAFDYTYEIGGWL